MKNILICTPKYGNRTIIVDDEDFEEVSKHTWSLSVMRSTNMTHEYAVTWLNGKMLSLHRFLMNPKNKQQVDHINHNTLDNRKNNLRLVTQQQNVTHQRKTRVVSKYKGVYWHKQRNKWGAQIKINQKKQHLGLFLIEEDAAKAYDTKAKELFGEFAKLNFPNE